MPLVNRAVTPIYLSRKRISGDQKVENECEVVANNTLVGTIKQLACLVRYADDIFTRIHGECKVINNRFVLVKNKLENVTRISENFDAKSVEVPEGDLESFTRTKKHYQTTYEAEQSSRNLFLIDNRPEFIQNVYDRAAEKPFQVIKSIEEYRKDELAFSKFSSNLHNRKNKSQSEPDLEIETRKPATLFKLIGLKSRKENEDVQSSTDTLIASTKILPSPEELTKATAEEYPAMVVPIDVTGAGFQRMSNFRKSLLQITFLERRRKKKKAKRRNTICEGENSTTLKKDVQDALTQTDTIPNKSVKRRSLGLFKLRRKSADMLDSSDSIFLNGTLRSKKISMSASCQTDDIFANETSNKGSEKTLSASKDKENLSGSNRFLRGFFRSTKSKSLKNSTSSVNKESLSTKGAQNKKGNSVIPISTLSPAMNVAVKMRDSSVRVGKNSPKDEDRNSSSGNWSASSSTRTSFDSECAHKNIADLSLTGMTYSQSSTESPGYRTENQNGGNCSQEETITGASGYTSDSTVNGTMSTCSFAYQSTNRKSSKSRTDMWLHRHAKANLNSSVDEHTSDGDSSTPLVLSPFTTRRRKTSNPVTDDESSVYSVDTDGYYTSMHTDSGLRGGLLPSPPPLPPLASCSEKDSTDTMNPSEIEFSNSDTICIRQKPTPPCPPPRNFSKSNNISVHSPSENSDTPVDIVTADIQNDNLSQTNVENSRSNSISSTSSNTTDSSITNSESDPEAVKRLKNKTTIDTKGYPSMVHVSESEDDYDVKAALSSSNYWQKAGYVGSDKIYAKPSALRSPVISSKTFVNGKNSVSPETVSMKVDNNTHLNNRSPEPVDIKLITYPVTQTKTVNTHTSKHFHPSVGRHSLKRPTTLNIKGVNISEHDVPMLQTQYGVNVSTVPQLYCDTLLKQKSGLQRSQSMKQEQQPPLSPKSQLISTKMTCSPDTSYGSNSLGRRRNKHPMMNVESVVAAQLPLSKKYSTLPTKLKYNSSLSSDDKSKNSANGKIYSSFSLDRRSLKKPLASSKVNSPITNSASKHLKSPQNDSKSLQLNKQEPVSTKQPRNIQLMKKVSKGAEQKINNSPVNKSQLVSSLVTSSSSSHISGSNSSAGSSQESSPRSQTEQSKPKKSTMSAQDLFLAIHNSKKKLNIKTDPFMSPMSSRSTSPNVGKISNSSSRASTPSCASPTPSIQSNISNGTIPRKAGAILAETGFLSPRGASLRRNSPGERKSWAAGSRNSPSPRNVQSEKSSLSVDRLRNKKPTSITDFKKLLLQTKTSSGHQRSAAEMLRATSPIPGRTSSPSNASHFQPISPVPVSSTGSNDLHVSVVSQTGGVRPQNGHILSPFKRGNRLRSSLPVNGMITSPIWEDNGEVENGTFNSLRVSRPSNAPAANQRTYGYLSLRNCQTANSSSSQSPSTNNGPILHIPTRSPLESSV